MQDRRGFLWFGTRDGLNRYNGYDFSVFRNVPTDSTSISENSIWSMAEDDEGRLWIATDGGGLNRYDPHSGRFVRYSSTEPEPRRICSDRLYGVYPDADGTLWLATQKQGLCRFDPASGRTIQYRHRSEQPTSISNNTIITVLRTRDGVLWVGTGDGLNRFDPLSAHFFRYFHDPHNSGSLSNDVIQVLFEDTAGTLWIGTDRGLNRWDPRTQKFARFRPPSPKSRDLTEAQVTGIIELRPGELWISTNGEGLYRIDLESDRVTTFRHRPGDPAGLPMDDLLFVEQDATGIIWIGTGGAGVSKLTPWESPFIQYRHDPKDKSSLGAPIVRSFTQRRPGELWIGHAGGIDRMDIENGRFAQYEPDPSRPNTPGGAYVRAIAADPDGVLWIGMNGSGLDRFDPSTESFRHFRRGSSGLSDDHVRDVLVDRRGDVWIGTDAGLDVLNPASGTFRHYDHEPNNPVSLSYHRITCLLEDDDGHIWVGTRSGLNRFVPADNRFVRYLHEPEEANSLSHDYVNALYESRDGTLWIGTYGGLNRLDKEDGTIASYTVADGLPNDVIHGILEDDAGRLWLSTNLGLSRFDPRSETFESFDITDGLPSNEFKARAAYRGLGGRLFFGTNRGFVVVDPDIPQKRTAAPPVVLTAFEVFGREAALESPPEALEQVRLRHDDAFAFEFAALDFAAPAKNRYAYRLEGLDSDWIQAGTRRYVSYAGVPPGTYTFRVIAANSSGVWNTTGMSTRLTVTPPFWQTWWFYSLSALLLAGVLAAAYQYRVRHLVEIERTRTRIADDLHDDIGSKVSSIALMLDVIGRTAPLSEGDRLRLQDTAGTARQVVDDLRDTVWIIDAGHDRLPELVGRMEIVANQMLEGVRHRVLLPEDVPPLVLDMDTRRNVLMIFREALHNAVRHADASCVEVTVGIEDGVLAIDVRDDGRGFDSSGPSRGRGMQTMRRRARQAGGALEIASTPGEGTHVGLIIKIG